MAECHGAARPADHAADFRRRAGVLGKARAPRREPGAPATHRSAGVSGLRALRLTPSGLRPLPPAQRFATSTTGSGPSCCHAGAGANRCRRRPNRHSPTSNRRRCKPRPSRHRLRRARPGQAQTTMRRAGTRTAPGGRSHGGCCARLAWPDHIGQQPVEDASKWRAGAPDQVGDQSPGDRCRLPRLHVRFKAHRRPCVCQPPRAAPPRSSRRRSACRRAGSIGSAHR